LQKLLKLPKAQDSVSQGEIKDFSYAWAEDVRILLQNCLKRKTLG